MTTTTDINMSVHNFSTIDAFLSDQLSTGDNYTNSDINMTILSSTIVNSIIATSVEVIKTTVSSSSSSSSSSLSTSSSSPSSTSSTSPACEPQSILYKYLRLLCEVMTVYFTPIITIAGTVGNILSVMVFFCTKLKKLSSSYYLGFLAFFDTGFLWCNFTQWLTIFGIHIYNSDGFCQLFTWLSNACSVLSVWFVVAFTIERFVAVMYPLKRPTLCTVRRARCIVFYLVVFNAINSAPLLLFATIEFNANSSNHVQCVSDNYYKVPMTIFFYYDFFVAFLIPLTLIISLNTVTAYTVWKLARVRRTMTNHKRKKGANIRNSAKRDNPLQEFHHGVSETETSEQSMKITNCTHLNGHHSIKQSCPKTRSSQMKVTKMLLIVSTVFVLLNLPSYVLRVWGFLVSADASNHWFVLMQNVSQIFFVSNFGINFVLYCMSGQNFRNELVCLFRRKPQRRLEGTQVTVSEYLSNIGAYVSNRKRIVTKNVSWNDLYE